MTTDHTDAIRNSPDDQNAWDRWFRAVYPRVYYIIFSKTGGDSSLSEELTQAALERFLRYKGQEKITSDKEAVAYLVTIASRIWSDLRQLPEESLSSETINTVPSPSTQQENLDLHLLSKKLGEEERQLVIWLCEGRSISEIASRLGIAYSAAGTRLHRVRTQLRKIAAEM